MRSHWKRVDTQSNNRIRFLRLPRRFKEFPKPNCSLQQTHLVSVSPWIRNLPQHLGVMLLFTLHCLLSLHRPSLLPSFVGLALSWCCNALFFYYNIQRTARRSWHRSTYNSTQLDSTRFDCEANDVVAVVVHPRCQYNTKMEWRKCANKRCGKDTAWDKECWEGQGRQEWEWQ